MKKTPHFVLNPKTAAATVAGVATVAASFELLKPDQAAAISVAIVPLLAMLVPARTGEDE